jgi:two-component system alkaline phosphatase synthesis response regulator PhoP
LSKAASFRRFHDKLSQMMQERSAQTLNVGSLSLDMTSHTVHSLKGTSKLCPKEASLLAEFMNHPGEVLGHESLMRKVWKTEYVEDLGTLWTHICSLRQKIEPYTNRRVYLHTVRGIGYRLDVWPPPVRK